MPPTPASRPPALATLMGVALGGSGYYHESAFLSGGDGDRGHHGHHGGAAWGDYAARRLRYSVMWGCFEGSVYRDLHHYASGLKERHDLYEHIRPIYNPTARSVEFWAGALMGGQLDREAGDGKLVPSCLPILTDNEAIRPAIAKVRRDSNWQVRKDTWGRAGAAMGDSPLLIVDDPRNRTVTFKPVHPGSLVECDRDAYGNVKSYYLEEWRPDPESDQPNVLVRYGESCVAAGDSVTFTTFRDGQPFDWRLYETGEREVGPSWDEAYPFCPMVVAQHRDMGLGWGWAEMFGSLPKLFELDDIASKLDDGIRKAVDPRLLFSGVENPGRLRFREEEDDDETGDYRRGDGSDRDLLDALYATDPAAKAQPLIGSIQVGETSTHLASILDAIEREHPELTVDRIGDNASGKARKIALERIEALTSARRAGYDDAQVRANMMAMSIGGARRYPGFEGIDRNSYYRGDLAHTIADRPVFAVDDDDRIASGTARATHLKLLVDAGMGLGEALEVAGFPSEFIARAKAGSVEAGHQAADRQRRVLMGSEQADAQL